MKQWCMFTVVLQIYDITRLLHGSMHDLDLVPNLSTPPPPLSLPCYHVFVGILFHVVCLRWLHNHILCAFYVDTGLAGFALPRVICFQMAYLINYLDRCCSESHHSVSFLWNMVHLIVTSFVRQRWGWIRWMYNAWQCCLSRYRNNRARFEQNI